MDKFIIYINYGDSVIEYILPGLNNRTGELDLSSVTGIKDLLISYEVWDHVWSFRSSERVRLSYQHYIFNSRELKNGEVYTGKVYSTGEHFSVMIQAFRNEMASFDKFSIQGYDTVTIGSARDSFVNINNKFVSNCHAILSYQNGCWYLFDKGKNGTYVNYKKVHDSCKLKPFDQIYILGYKIVFLGHMIAVNQMCDVTCALPKIDIDQVKDMNVYGDMSAFSRMPRFIEPFDEEKIEIEGPPGRHKERKTPLLFLLGPSITMPLPILVTVLFNVYVNSKTNSSGSPLMYMGMMISVIMFAGIGIMWAMLRNKYDQKVLREEEELRQIAYHEYIKKNEDLLLLKQDYNRNILSKKYLSSRVLLGRFSTDVGLLWNRNVNHEDFMEVRLGTGLIKSPNQIVIPKEKFSIDKDDLVEEPARLFQAFEYIKDAVKLLNLKDNKIIGITGSNGGVLDVTNNIIVQLAALHSYTDVKIAVLYGDEYDLEWTKWLPHVFSKDKKKRYVGNNEKSVKNVIGYLMEELRSRNEKLNSEEEDVVFPDHYVVFCSEKEYFDNEQIYKYMTSKDDYGFTFVLLYGTISKLPNECKYVIENSDSYQGIYQLNESFDYTKTVTFDTISSSESETFARMIAAYNINEISEGGIPDAVDYLEMLGIGRVEQWDLLKCYKEHRAYEGISSFIGITAGNKPMYLDIHEKKHGPHGLVAGTTGSGKSETIQTFILSLALNYHPDEVAFILIDYKGGGMANVFQKLPHLAGTITNLGAGDDDSDTVDESLTRRALISIRSEIKRRQKIFNQYKINHIDAYIKLYRDGQATEPLPHLIIISDEFAELKKEQPEFIRELVSAARVGRSLGIHLILATQKPAGVVDDEIWSNSRFKLCLKVQDKQDSMGMLKRPEAAYLTQTGRAYLQIGNDESFDLFQSGYSGADYEPHDSAGVIKDTVSMIDIDGSSCVEKRKKRDAKKNVISQLDACVNYISDVAAKNGIHSARALWLPPLSGHIYVDDLIAKYNLDFSGGTFAWIGEIDNPEKQDTLPYVIDFNQMSNLMILGNSGSGKSNMLTTMITSMMRFYSPEYVQFYILDFSGRTMKQYMSMPHVGEVFYSDDTEGVPRVFQFLQEMINDRREKFQRKGIGSFVEYQKLSEEPMPTVFFIVDNYFEFIESYENLEESFAKLSRDGSKYGIQVIITANTTTDVRYKTRKNFTNVIPLQLMEKGDYLDVLGKSPAILPSSITGRGLVVLDDVLEFQTALPIYGDTEIERMQNLKKFFAEYCQDYKGYHARRIPVLPENKSYAETLEDFGEFAENRQIPFAYEMENIVPVALDFRNTYCFSLSATTTSAIINVFKNISYAAGLIQAQVYMVNLSSDFAEIRSMVDGEIYDSQDRVYDFLIMLKKEFKARSSRKKELIANGVADPLTVIMKEFTPLVVLIDDFDDFIQKIYDTSYKEAMNNIVELFFKEGRQLGIMFAAGFAIDFSAGSFYTQACKTYTQYRTGVHIGGRLNDQRLFDFAMTLNEKAQILPDNVGHMMSNGAPCKVYIPIHER